MAARCFEQIHKNVKNSSEYTRNRRLKQRWCELYQMDPFNSKTKYAVGIRSNRSMILLTAPSQGELLDLVNNSFNNAIKIQRADHN